MAANINKNSSLTSDEEDDCSEDDEKSSEGRRRRFCIERKLQQQQQTGPSGSKPKRSRLDQTDQHKSKPQINYVRTSERRKKVRVDNRPSSAKVFQTANNNKPERIKQQQIQPPQELQEPVIYINPKFIKKFIEKSIKLTHPSTSSATTTDQRTSVKSNTDSSSTSHNIISPASSSMIEDIDFKTSSRESLQAASTMAIIRLVTECIEDDNKRDEKLNKTLVSRLIDGLSSNIRHSSST